MGVQYIKCIALQFRQFLEQDVETAYAVRAFELKKSMKNAIGPARNI